MKINTKLRMDNTFWPVVVMAFLVAAAFLSKEGPAGGGNSAMLPRFPEVQRQEPLAPGVAAQGPAAGLSVQEGINRVVSLVRPSVVGISRKVPAQFVGNNGGLSYIGPFASGNRLNGSGVIIDRRGYVLTSFQMVGADKSVRVTLFSGGRREYEADVMGVDATTDLAVLKIRDQGVFPAAVLGNSDLLEVGDFVLAVGSPYGFSSSVTMGIVSSNHRRLSINGVHYPEMIQTDAPVNEGNDGGPLVNIKGEVVGINMASYTPGKKYTGIGFAIPINNILALVKNVL